MIMKTELIHSPLSNDFYPRLNYYEINRIGNKNILITRWFNKLYQGSLFHDFWSVLSSPIN